MAKKTPTPPQPRRFKTGRLPRTPRLSVELTSAQVPAGYLPPATLDRYSAVPAASWGMDGNDDAGDCTCADVDHEVKSDEVAAGNTEVDSTASEVLAAYSAITGYNPNDPSTDQGAQMQDVRAYWRKTGFMLGGQAHKILLYASLQVSDYNLVKWGVDQFGSVGIGINFPNSAMDQFNANEPWDVVPNEPEPTEGHAIPIVGWDGQYWYIVTWGKVQKMTQAFFEKYVEEAWASLTQDFVNSVSGDDPLAQSLYQMGEQFATVTGQTNPVPAPQPTPPTPEPSPAPPTPEPAPTPVPDDVTQAMITAGDTWEKTIFSRLTKAAKFKAAFDAFKQAHGFKKES